MSVRYSTENQRPTTDNSEAEGKGFEPSSRVENHLSKAARPTVSGYLPIVPAGIPIHCGIRSDSIVTQ